MILIAAMMFYNFSQSKSIIFLVLTAFAMAFVAIYFYRIFLMRIVFEGDKVIFKGFTKRITIHKNEIYDIQIIKQIGREVDATKYTKTFDTTKLNSKCYVMIRKNGKYLQTNLSMFNASCADYITLEYTPGVKSELDKLLL